MADTARPVMPELLGDVTQDHARTGTPLRLSLSIPGIGEVLCSDVFRVIRGKRIVCLGNVRGTKVIVKLYFARRRAYRHWKRSESGCRVFIERGIPAPKILYSGYLRGHGLYAIVMEYLEGGTRIDRELEKTKDARSRVELLGRLVRELARHHEAGIIQNDVHLGNFMVRDQRVYSLDGDQVVRCWGAPGKKRSLDSLVRLLANLPAGLDADLDTCIRCYMEGRRWSISPAGESSVKEMVYRARRKGLSSYLGKTLRSRDPFRSQSSPGLFTVFDKRHTDLNLADILDAAGIPVRARGELGRAGYLERTCGTQKLLELASPGHGPLVCKALFRAVRTWRYALVLNRIGVQAPVPVALVLKKKAPCMWQCSVFFRTVEGVGLMDVLHAPETSREGCDRISAGLTDTFARMCTAGLSPMGLMPDHILISGERTIVVNPGILRRPVMFSRVRLARGLRMATSRFGYACAKKGLPGEGPI